MLHLGDITKINGAEIQVVDIICGGSPCQDLSVAGKRAGLSGERSGLFMEQIRIIKEMREHDVQCGRPIHLARPRFCIWENVPGAFSSNGGKDFQAVLTEFARVSVPECPDVPMPKDGKWSKSGCLYDELGRWSIAWRVHDAQFWGVPQRRKRIALVADFGGLSAPEILFERKGLSRDPEPGEPQREGASESLEGSAGKSISFQERAGCAGGGKGILIQNERTGALSTLNNQSVMAYGISSLDSNAMKSPNPHSGIYEADSSRTLDNNGGNPACNQGGMIVLEGNGSRESHKGDGFAVRDTMYKLNTVEQHAVAVDVYNQSITGETAPTVSAAVGGANTSGPKLLVAGFKAGNGDRAAGIGYEDEMSPTLAASPSGTNQVPTICLNDQGGGVMSVTSDRTATIRAQMGGHPPVVLGRSISETEQSTKG